MQEEGKISFPKQTFISGFLVCITLGDFTEFFSKCFNHYCYTLDAFKAWKESAAEMIEKILNVALIWIQEVIV